jgi:heme A synthase
MRDSQRVSEFWANVCGLLMLVCMGLAFMEASADHPRYVVPFLLGFVGYAVLFAVYATKASRRKS